MLLVQPPIMEEASKSSFGTRKSVRELEPLSWKHVGPKLNTGRRKKTPAQRVERLFTQLVELVHTEWRTIRSLNLGVTSGTGIVNELIMQQLQQWVKELHMLCITEDEASQRLGELARKLDRSELQQLQVMLDTSNNAELSDFMRLMVFNVSDPFVSQPVDVACGLPAKSSSRAGRSHSAIRAHSPGMAGLNLGRARRPCREEPIRFTGLLPPEHPLAVKALQLHLSRLPDDSDESDLASRPGTRHEDEMAAMLRDYPVTRMLGPCRLRESSSRLEPAPPPLYSDIEARWRSTTHTFEKDLLLNNVMISDPLPAWLHMPEFKEKHLAALKEAQARQARQASARGDLGGLSREPSSRVFGLAQQASRTARSHATSPTPGVRTQSRIGDGAAAQASFRAAEGGGTALSRATSKLVPRPGPQAT